MLRVWIKNRFDAWRLQSDLCSGQPPDPLQFMSSHTTYGNPVNERSRYSEVETARLDFNCLRKEVNWLLDRSESKI